MTNNLPAANQAAIVQTLENNLRNPDASNTSDVFQQQLAGMSHADVQKVVSTINRDKQMEGYSTSTPLPGLTLHEDGKITEKIAGNSSDLTVWAGNEGAKPGSDHKAPDNYTGTLEHGGLIPASEAFFSDLGHDPGGAFMAAMHTIGDEASALKQATLGSARDEIKQIPGQ